MSINTSKLKKFAPSMRNFIIEAVGRKLDLLLNNVTPDSISTYSNQIEKIRIEQEKNRDELLERVAYTWFNRFCALRFLDAKCWHPFGCKVIMPLQEENQPELLKLLLSESLPSELKNFTNHERLKKIIDGEIQIQINSLNSQFEVYRELILATCRFYQNLLPHLFTVLDETSELLLPDDLLSQSSFVNSFRVELKDEDCLNVETLGWLYQFYISEKKDEVMSRKSTISTKDIPIVTQLFTPHWIVRYIVENSLGKLWLLNHPNSKLIEHMPYYLKSESEKDFIKISSPEEIKILDPACGSGHLLTYAFDLLYLIYEEEGYSQSEIPELILKNNIQGVEICQRAAQLSELALVFKAREKSRSFFNYEPQLRPKIIELRNLNLSDSEIINYCKVFKNKNPYERELIELNQQFKTVKDIGSLIKPFIKKETLKIIREYLESEEIELDLFQRETHLKVLLLLHQSEILTSKYQIIIANPPYMGSGGMNNNLSSFLKKEYQDAKYDLMTAFIHLCINHAENNGFCGIVTLDSWMFLTSYKVFRNNLLAKTSINSMIHIGWNCFPEGHTYNRGTAFILEVNSEGREGKFIDLSNVKATVNKETLFLSRLISKEFNYSLNSKDFSSIPEKVLGYWMDEHTRNVYKKSVPLKNIAPARVGIGTGDNDTFTRFWWEIDKSLIGFQKTPSSIIKEKWIPYNKGGAYRKWYGNQTHLIKWENDGEEIKNFKKSVVRNKETYFLPSLSWSKVTSAGFSLRYYPQGFLYDVAGCSIFFRGDKAKERALLGLINSQIMNSVVKKLSPTINFEVGQMGYFPILPNTLEIEDISNNVERLVAISKDDWDSQEISWNFNGHGLLSLETKNNTLSGSCDSLLAKMKDLVSETQELENKNNKILLKHYGLENNINPDLPIEEITLYANPAYSINNNISDCQLKNKQLILILHSFISYSVGCMMGRYSLEKNGLILASSQKSQEDHLSCYEEMIGKSISEIEFKPDSDGIIPVLDGEWFEDDIVSRAKKFIEVLFPINSLNENLRFIENTIGKDLRKYFCKDFYKDHLQAFGDRNKKRPIYWMVQSPNGGFACLIYVHRYTPDTFLQILNKYYRPYIQKLDTRLSQLRADQLNESIPKKEQILARNDSEKINKIIKECQKWERDSLLPIAQQRIKIDLNDGVKVNYLKLQEVLAKIPGLKS